MTTTKCKIGTREIRALGQNSTLWDTRVPGFCARRRDSQSVVYAVKYRTQAGRQRWHTIGRHGAPWTPDAARDQARRILSEVFKGQDPAGERAAKRQAATVADLCEAYLDAAVNGRLLTRRGGSKKPSTLATDQSRIDAHIKPLLGDRMVTEIDRQDVERFMHDIAAGRTKRSSRLAKPRAVSNVTGGKGAATRTVGLLGGIFTFAVRSGLRTDNPVTGVVRFADGVRDRRLSDGEYQQLGEGLRASTSVWPFAGAAVRFLALTGWRSGEALGLRWRDIDITRKLARLPDTKSGASMRPLSRAALSLLDELSGDRDALVFRSSRGDKVMSGFPSMFAKIAMAGGLPKEVTPHVLRHSFASVAADLGFSELTIAVLLGHQSGSVTSRYTHHADKVLLAAADEVAGRIAGMLAGEQEAGNVVPLREVGNAS